MSKKKTVEGDFEKGMVYVSRKEHFNAAHKLANPAWSKEENEKVFGKCANEYYHGHNFEIIVTVKGRPDATTGFVVDMKKLGDLIKQEIIEKVDHKNLNEQVPFLKGKMCSCEIIVQEFWKILEDKVALLSQTGKLYSIRLIETNKNFVDYYG